MSARLRIGRWLCALVVGVGIACARMGDPPGGPKDFTPPRLVGTYPESLLVIPGFKGNAEFRFSEIVSEGSQPNFGLGSGDLEKLIVLSPSRKVPEIGWHKSRITVRPREGWKPNLVYRIELLPGLLDLRNNRTKEGEVITFTTGAPLPTLFIRGRVIDWSTRRPEVLALVQAMLMTSPKDSLIYKGAADSLGYFTFGPLPAGPYLVFGVQDQNHNRRLDGREAFDTVRLAAGQDSVGEIWEFKHDTLPARIQAVTIRDSISIELAFSQQLDPYQLLRMDSVRLRKLPDSTAVTVEGLFTKQRYDSVYGKAPVKPDTSKADSIARAKVVADSIAKVRADSLARADSIRRAEAIEPGARRRARRTQAADTVGRGPLLSRPELYDHLVIRTKVNLEPNARYLVEVFGIRNVSQVAGRSSQGFKVPEEKKPPPVDSTKLKADSVAKAKADSAKAKAAPQLVPVRPDTAAARRDTTRRAPPPAPPPPPPPPPSQSQSANRSRPTRS
ncbi:MAG: Ig-like domain-containing protein [Gemmatimonadota bacterium]